MSLGSKQFVAFLHCHLSTTKLEQVGVGIKCLNLFWDLFFSFYLKVMASKSTIMLACPLDLMTVKALIRLTLFGMFHNFLGCLSRNTLIVRDLCNIFPSILVDQRHACWAQDCLDSDHRWEGLSTILCPCYTRVVVHLVQIEFQGLWVKGIRHPTMTIDGIIHIGKALMFQLVQCIVVLVAIIGQDHTGQSALLFKFICQ
jgi:hypothetical protein